MFGEIIQTGCIERQFRADLKTSLGESSPGCTKMFKEIPIVRPKLLLIILLWRRKKSPNHHGEEGIWCWPPRFWEGAGC